MFKKINKFIYKKNLNIFYYNLYLWNLTFFLKDSTLKKNNIFYYLSIKKNLFLYLKTNLFGGKIFKKYYYFLINYFLKNLFYKFDNKKIILNKKFIFIFLNFLKSQIFFNLSENTFLSKTSFSIGIVLKLKKIMLKNLRRKKKGEKFFLKFINSFILKKFFLKKNVYLVFKGKYLKTKNFLIMFLKKTHFTNIVKIIHTLKQTYGITRFRKVRSIKKKLKKKLKKNYIIF